MANILKIVKLPYLSNSLTDLHKIWHKWTLTEKGKERKSIYIVPFIVRILSKRSDMDHAVLPANYTMPASQPHWTERAAVCRADSCVPKNT